MDIMDEKQQVVKQESAQERMWAMLCHLAAFAAFIFPFGHIIAPLVIWLIKKEELPFVEDQGKESLNFQISITIYLIIASILMLILIGFVLMIGLIIFDIVMVIIASMKANEGEKYRYPLCIRFIK